VLIVSLLTHIEAYADVVSDNIISTLKRVLTYQELKEKMRKLAGKVPLNLFNLGFQYNFFLSHKRSSGQVIAGRLYESLTNKGFKVFIDSEEFFDLHDLDHSVTLANVFVLILSKDYPQSEWCLRELRSALINKIKIIVVEDFNHPTKVEFQSKEAKILEPLKVEDVKKAISGSPSFSWIAEYHSECVKRLIKESNQEILLKKPEKIA
jgi:hypothetical protein